MIRGIQLIGILVGLFFCYQSLNLVRKKREELTEFVLWLCVGASILAISLSPSLLDYLLGFLSMTNRVYLIFTLGILLSYLLLYRIFRVVRDLDRQISQLNESIGILRFDLEKKDDGGTKRGDEMP